MFSTCFSLALDTVMCPPHARLKERAVIDRRLASLKGGQSLCVLCSSSNNSNFFPFLRILFFILNVFFHYTGENTG